MWTVVRIIEASNPHQVSCFTVEPKQNHCKYTSCLMSAFFTNIKRKNVVEGV